MEKSEAATRKREFYITNKPFYTRFTHSVPHDFRIILESDGSMTLEGAYRWQEGLTVQGVEWKPIPIHRRQDL